jgi:hypothetical protein
MAPRPEKVRPKKSYFSSTCEYVKLPFSLRVPKAFLFHLTDLSRFSVEITNC